MKKRIIFYVVLLLVVAGFCYCNYGFEIKNEDISIKSIISDDSIITVEGKLKDYKKAYSIKTENAGDVVYISVKAKNIFKKDGGEFNVSIANKNNCVRQVVLNNKNERVVIFENKDFGKTGVFFADTEISSK